MPPSGRHWLCSPDLAVHSMICSRSFLVSSPAPSRFKCHLLCAISGPRASCFYLSGLRPRALYWSYYTAVFRACPLHAPLPPCPSPETDREGPCRPQSEGPCRPHPRLAQGLPYNGWSGGAHWAGCARVPPTPASRSWRTRGPAEGFHGPHLRNTARTPSCGPGSVLGLFCS